MQAIELSPGFELAAFQLFDMQCADREHEAAEETLTKIAGHIHPKEIAVRRVWLATQQHRPEHAVAQLAVLADPADDRDHLLGQAADAFLHAGWAPQLEHELSDRLGDDNAAIGTAWVRAVDQLRPVRVASAIHERLGAEGVSTICLVGICDGLIAVKKPSWIAGIVSKWERPLRENTWSWGNVGRIFSQINEDARAAVWMSDWAERADAESWMLINLAMSLRGLGRTDEARAVHEHALANAAPDVTNAYHEWWLTLELAPCARWRRSRITSRTDLASLDGYHYLIATFARALLVTITAPDRTYAFDEARHQLTQAARTIEPLLQDGALRKTYRRVVWQMAANCGGLRHKAWALWRTCRPVLPRAKV